ncbi:hypothetical protein DASC09_000400 [Saccharomycopsis crataegensis]|uniref:Ras GTPase-activating-like protein IQG1 n=1 Tax=Saccharomycopsis crataegensis TaxID=43959 RepID=A0AAV5QE39_9ASCO|nr:hypothetical protein DASC09_000400 [Saccharomycopsis crataegensis]
MVRPTSSPKKNSRLAARYLENITDQSNNLNPVVLSKNTENNILDPDSVKRKLESPLSSPKRSKSFKRYQDSPPANKPTSMNSNALRSPVMVVNKSKEPEDLGNLYSRDRLKSVDNNKKVQNFEDKENDDHGLPNIQNLHLKTSTDNTKTSPSPSPRRSPSRLVGVSRIESRNNDTNNKKFNFLDELESFNEKRKNNQVSLKKTHSIAQGRTPKGNKGYEFLCRVAEIKQWIEECLGEKIASTLELSKDGLKNGVILAKVTKHFVPELVKRIIPANSRGAIEYRHTENIVHFFYFLDYIDMPDLFRFELTDLYDGKNIPKVIFCLYALCFMLSQQDDAPKLKSLVGKLAFEESDIKNSERRLKEASVPDFGSFEPLMKSLELENGFFTKAQEEEPERQQITQENISISLDESPLDMNTQSRLELSEIHEDEPLASIPKVRKIISKPKIQMEPEEEEDMHEEEENNHVRFTQSTLRRVDSIKKPTYNDFSAVEIEDTTIIQEQVSEDMSENELDYVLRNIIEVQSLGRGFIARFQVFVKTTMLKTFAADIIQLQSIARKNLFMKSNKAKILAKKKKRRVNGNFIIHLQAKVRGSLVRRQIMVNLIEIKREKYQIVQFQSIIRGEISRFFTDSLLIELEEHDKSISQFQAILKGILVRKDATKKEIGLLKSRRKIITLQSVIRSSNLRRNILFTNENFESISSNIIELQSIIRTHLYHKCLNDFNSYRASDDDIIVKLQSLIRGKLVRDRCKDIYYNIYKARSEIMEIQMVARGGLSRQRLSKMIMGLDYNDTIFEEMTAIIRGGLARNRMNNILDELDHNYDAIILLQANIKGVLTRFKMELLFDDLWEHEKPITKLQSMIRGGSVRKNMKDIVNYYDANVDKVIKIQSFIRARNQNDAYRKLIATKNPSLAVVRQFAYLLNDTNKDLEEEVRFENLNHQIMVKSNENSELEKHCNELDAKIALLVKNKITLDELIHQNKKQGQLELEFKKKIQNDEIFLNSHKSKSMEYEAFESLIYVLQTCPEYFVRLFRTYNTNYNAKEEIEKMVLICLAYAGTKDHSKVKSSTTNGVMSAYRLEPEASYSLRDEFLFMNLVISAIKDHIGSANSLEDFCLNSTVLSWQKLLNFFNKSTNQRKLAKKIFGSLITSISEIDNLSMESNPLKIYKEIIATEEQETGKKSIKPRNVTAETAIQDAETRQQFIKNLNLLRELTIKVLSTIEDNINLLPTHIKTICFHTFMIAKKHFASNTDGTNAEDQAFAFALSILMDHYVIPIISSPENYNISLITFSTKETLSLKANFGYICDVLAQIASMTEFSLSQVYYQPLNEFIQSSIPMAKRIAQRIFDVGDVETAYNMNIYNDLTARVKPSLIVKNVELLSFKNFIQEYIDDMAPSKSDPIHEYAQKLSKVRNIARGDQISKEVRLLLNPCIKNFAGVKTKTLTLDAKRCMLYIMQVQSTKKNLLELLLSRITDRDEERFEQMMLREKRNYQRQVSNPNHKPEPVDDYEKNEFSKSTFMRNVSTMSYHQLKSHTLEVILELESMGKLNRENKFQTLLNEIAFDIKTKHDQRMKRAKEIRLSVQTLDSLNEKEKYLRNLLETYNNYIKKSMEGLQESSYNNSLNKKKKLLPFSKQYFYQKALKRRGKQSKFGVYQYSAKYLYENKILLEINGVKHLDLLKVDFIFSCDEVGVFMIELEGGLIDDNSVHDNDKRPNFVSSKIITGNVAHITKSRNSSSRLTLDDLLQSQYEGKSTIAVYNGIVNFDTINLLTFILKKFYDSHSHSTGSNTFGSSLTSTVSLGSPKKHGFASSFASSFGTSFGSKR